MTVMRVLLRVLHVFILRECEGARATEMLVWGDGISGSVIVYSAADVLCMRGVGEVCEMCMARAVWVDRG